MKLRARAPVVLLLACVPALLGAIPRPAAMRDAWADYRKAFVTADGRVVDPRSGHTTSEGQAYALARATWADDRASFALVRRWTRDHLQGGDPSKLPAWQWGRRPDGSYGVLDASPAADADQWLAWSLLLGADRWRDPELAAEARGLVDAVWRGHGAVVGAHTVLVPGPWALERDPVEYNPSYFLPFVLRDFAAIDPVHPWRAVLDDGYALLGDAMRDGRLPPDWMWLDAKGQRVPQPEGNARHAPDQFGFEAMRIPWALAADAAWHGDGRALGLLANFAALEDDWRTRGLLGARLTADGKDAATYESLALYGSLLPAWSTRDGRAAAALFEAEIAPTRTGPGWGPADDYYAQNWTWFGLALWTGLAGPLGSK